MTFDQFPIELFSLLRDSFLYMTFGTPLREVEEPNGTYDFYQAERSLSGWRTVRRLSPSGAEAVIPNAGGVSPDHNYAFVHVSPLPSSSGGNLGIGGSAAYLGNPDGSFELVGVGPLGTERSAQGRYISPNGEHVIFSTGSDWCAATSCQVLQLEPNAPPTGTPAVYDRSADGLAQVVSLLPGNVTPAAGQAAAYQGSSPDGSVIAFKVSGSLYVRVDNSVTELVTSSASTFAGFSSDGSALFYVSGGNIFKFDISSTVTTQINASGDAEVVNISADGSHVYFISPSLLDGSEGVAAEPNMYVWRNGNTEYVTTVAPSDLNRTSGNKASYPSLTNWTDWVVTPIRTSNEEGVGPGGNSSRSTQDGIVLVFESRAQLTGFDNQGHTEVYRYNDLAQDLLCVSCPSDGPATADARLQELEVAKPWVTLHNVSTDGSRVFFETAEPLKSVDVNGINDIYEWRAGVSGTAGTVDLITTGKGVEYPPLIIGPKTAPRPNILLGITPDGRDVTFLSLERLLPEGPGSGSPAIYDARIGGGFPEAPPLAHCPGIEACRGASGLMGAPVLSAPASNATGGNLKPRRHRCRRFHRKGKAAKHRACHRQNNRKGAGN